MAVAELGDDCAIAQRAADDTEVVGYVERRVEPLPVDRVEAVRILLVRRAGVLFRRSPVGVTLVDPEGRHVVARKGTPSVSLTGDPVELLLFGVGRGARTRVEVQGPAAAVALLREARLGI